VVCVTFIKNIFKKFIAPKEFYKELFIVASPIALQQFISSLVNTIDTLMVANWGGVNATAGVAVANKYYLVFNMITMVTAVSCSVFIAQYFGAKRFDRLKQIFGSNIILCLLIGIIFLTVGLIFRNDIILFFIGTSTDTLSYDYGVLYLSVIVFSFIPQVFTNAIAMTFRPIKMATVPLYAAIVASVSNAFFNWIFIYGHLGVPSLGVQGAAIATVIARSIELLILIAYYFYRKPPFYGKFKEIFHIPSFLIKDILVKLRPLLFAQILTESIGIFMLMTYARLEIGNATNVAAITVSQQIVDIVMVLISGMGTAASVLVGTRLGANNIDEARNNARWQMAYITVFSILACVIIILLIPLVQKGYDFSGADASLLRMIMTIQAISLPFSAYAMNVIFITRAGGYTRSPIYISNLVYYFIKLPLIIYIVYINPSAFVEGSFFYQMMISLNLAPLFVVFVFVVERFIEILRFFVAAFIYRKVRWYNNITRTI